MIRIENKEDCCGCSACANICPVKCIEMKEDEEGFLYPHISQNQCIDCSACERVCPILNQKERKSIDKQRAYIVQNLNKEICRQSTAGGAFTAIAEYVIEHNGIVYGVEMNGDHQVIHGSAETKEELQKFRNSKYVQSYIGSTYEKVKQSLLEGRLVCFSGTPCQIEGVRNYLGKNYDNLILIDIVCRAVPSPGVWRKYIEMDQKEHGEIVSVRFRDKALGYQYSTMETKYVDGLVRREGLESHPWLRMFFSGMIIRPSCTSCKFRSPHRNSDFTIWDCFNIYHIDKSFNEDTGTTRMLVHSEKGNEIFSTVKDKLEWKEIEVHVAIDGVAEMRESPEIHPLRWEFFRDLQNVEMRQMINKYYPDTVSVKLKRCIRRILNMFGLDKVVKHVLKRR